jgi:hypothetical protein
MLALSAIRAGAAQLEIIRATFLGNGEGDIESVTAGPDGTLYVAGNTETPAAELPGGITPVTLGSDVADARCGYGFIARLSADAGRILAYAQFAKGVATLTTVQANEQGVYAGGYASDGLAPLLGNRRGLIRDYPLTNEVRLIREGKIAEACGETSVSNQPPKDPIADRPGLGRYGAPCILKFSAELKELQAGTYLEGWQQVWDKNRVIKRAINPETRKRESVMVPREFLWQPTGIGLLASGDVIVSHDGGYFRLLTDEDRTFAGTNTFLLNKLGFENVCDWVSRLSPDLSERAWRKSVYTPAVNPEVARRLKQGWPHPWYSNPRTLRLRLDREEAIVLCGWSASATVNEPYWTPYLWKLDPKTGELVWKAYEIDPMSGPDHRMNGNVADTAVPTVAIDDDNRLLIALHSDGGNNHMGAGPRAPEGVTTWATPVKKGGYGGGLVHFNGQMHRIDGKTRNGLAGVGTGHCAWTIDMAALPGSNVLAVGRCNGDIQLTPDAWCPNSPQANPNAYVRAYDSVFNMTFSTTVPGVWPFELARTSTNTYALAGYATLETMLIRDSLAPKPDAKRSGYLLLMKWK